MLYCVLCELLRDVADMWYTIVVLETAAKLAEALGRQLLCLAGLVPGDSGDTAWPDRTGLFSAAPVSSGGWRPDVGEIKRGLIGLNSPDLCQSWYLPTGGGTGEKGAAP